MLYKRIFLLLWSCFIAIISFSAFVGMYSWNRNRNAAVIWLVLTIVIFLCYVVSLIFLRKNFSASFLTFNILLCITLFVYGPQLQQYGIQIKQIFETPSNKVQTQMNQEVSDAIEKNNLPYKVDAELSKKMTNQKGKGVVALVKTKEGKIQKTEIDKIMSEPFSSVMFLSFYDYDKKWILSVRFNTFREIIYCYPFSKCEEFGFTSKR